VPVWPSSMRRFNSARRARGRGAIFPLPVMKPIETQRIARIRTGVHHHRAVRGPGNEEIEPVGLQSNAKLAAQYHRVRKESNPGRKSVKRRPSAHGSRQIIDRPRVTQEHR
jgi:hypothetical protein